MRDKEHPRCPEIEKVQPYIDGILPMQEANLFKGHLESCRQCLDELESLRQVSDVLHAAAREPVPGLDVARVRERLFGGRRHVIRRRPVLALAGAVGLVVACLVVVLYWPQGRHPRTVERVQPDERVQADDHITLVPLDGGQVTQRPLADGGTAVRLTSGALFVCLDRPLAGRFVVETPAGEVEATGTLFLVRVVDEKITAVVLLQGRLVTRPREGRPGSLIAPAFGMLCPAIRPANLDPPARTERPGGRVASKRVGGVRPLALVRRLLAERKIDRALAELNSYLVRKPGDPRAIFLLGDAHRLAERPTEALAAYQRAIRLGKNPRLAEAALYQIGLLQLRDLARPAEARRTFERLAREYPHGLLVQESFYHLAECRITLKDFQGAMRLLDEYLEKYPRGTKAAEARALLRAFEEKGWR